MLHFSVFVALPSQGLPLCCGAGLSHFLVCVFVPPPQIFVHAPNSEYFPHPPLIASGCLVVCAAAVGAGRLVVGFLPPLTSVSSMGSSSREIKSIFENDIS